MRYKPQRMVSSVITAGHGGWCSGTLRMLKDGDEEFH
jgi:hypothetical protein